MSNQWVAFQPLIGGMMIGAEKAFGEPPVAVVSFDGFLGNDRHYLTSYLWKKYPAIPYYQLNGDGTLKDVLVPNENLIPISIRETVEWDQEMMTMIMMKGFENTKYVVSVPVCAGLSGLNQNASDDHPHNDNMVNIFSWALTNIKPISMVGENAMEFSKTRGDKVRGRLTAIAEENGYKFSSCLTSTSYCGLPQNRVRSFFWTTKNAPLIPAAPPAENGYPTLTEMFANPIPSTDPMQNVEFAEREFIKRTPVVSYLKAVHPGTWRHWGRKHAVNDNLLRSNLALDCIDWIKKNIPNEYEYVKKLWDKIQTGGNIWDTGVMTSTDHVNALHGKTVFQYVHPFEDRFFTNREIMMLLGMPRDMMVLPSKPHEEATLRQVTCQNVPVNTAQWACAAMLNAENPKFLADSKVYFIDFVKKFGRIKPHDNDWLVKNHPESLESFRNQNKRKAEYASENDSI